MCHSRLMPTTSCRNEETLEDRYLGCGLGLLIGDAHCAPYEGGPLERGLWALIGKTHGKRRYTDDSQMAFDLARHLIEFGHIEAQELAQQFAASYRWSRGYGPSTVKVLRQINKGRDWQAAARHQFKDGSFGNGGAMRVAPLAVFLHQKAEVQTLVQMARQSAAVTHAHAEAIDASVAIALATFNGFEQLEPVENLRAIAKHLQTPALQQRIQRLIEWLAAKPQPDIATVKSELGAGTAARESIPVALYIALQTLEKNFSELLFQAHHRGGDTDTIGAMAGAIWGAYHGAAGIPADYLKRTEAVDEMRLCIAQIRHRTLSPSV